MLAKASLYLITGIHPGDHELDSFLGEVLAAGVDIVQLRQKQASSRRELLAAAAVIRRRTTESGALFIVNDDPVAASEAGADGVHLGQQDSPVEEARAILGPDALIGLSTHSHQDLRAASGVDYVGVGPVFPTPTKPGRKPVGLDLVRYAAGRAPVPFFAIGGIDVETLPSVIEAGARKVAVVRALTLARSPAQVARKMKLMLERAG